MPHLPPAAALLPFRVRGPLLFAAAAAAVAGLAPLAVAQTGRGLVNFESPHVHPLEVTPGGTRLLAVNTADNRLEVFALVGGVPERIGSIPVGLDPVSVRALSETRAWVVNTVSDSVSIVDLTTMNVVRTLTTRDEPADVVFAGRDTEGRPTRAFVSCGTNELVQVFDLANLAAAPQSIPIAGESPRAMAVSADGTRVFVAVFESGNRTTILGGGSAVTGGSMRLAFPPNVVSDATGPYAGQNPPPNAGTGFNPPLSADASPLLPVGLIVRKFGNAWRDDNGRDWTDLVSGANAARSGRPVGWDLTDHDVAIIDAATNAVTYADGLMTICMGIAVNPATGSVHVVGTEAKNHVRFEPVVNGRFVTVQGARFAPATPGATISFDLNPHLDYSTHTIPQPQRDLSLGDPRGIVFLQDGTGLVSGMGSNNLVPIAIDGTRSGPPIPVGRGPTGLAASADGALVYALNRFDATISVVAPLLGIEVLSIPFFDPTPQPIKRGRKHLYDTHKNSGLGQVACASCHVDGKIDRLAWDLGDPSGAKAQLTNRNLGFGIPGLEPNTTPTPYEPFHPMKGPMLTQTFQDIIGKEPFHWRGDRLGIEEFNGAFVGLQGDDTQLTPAEMQEFEDFLATITFPPNPNRNLDNTLPTSMPLAGHFTTGRFGAAGQPLPNGNAVSGLSIYRSATRRLDSNAFACVTCHTLPTGMGPDMTRTGGGLGIFTPIPAGPMGERHLGLVSVDGSTNVAIKVPQLRNIYKRTGFNATRLVNTSGFGMLHDGSVDSIERFVSEPVFTLASDQEVANMVAFMLSFSGSDLPQGSPTNILEPPGPPSKDSHAAVGVQVTFAQSPVDPAASTRLSQLVTIANNNKIGLVAKGKVAVGGGAPLARGFVYIGGGNFQTDRLGETLTQAQLVATSGPGAELTFTAVPKGTELRIGIDRDSDGYPDRMELDVCADPADALSFPGGPGNADYDQNGVINPDDLADFIVAFFSVPADPRADFDQSGIVNPDDLADFIARFFTPCL